MSKIILASGSPRRRELLSEMGVDFEVRVSDIDETPQPEWSPEEMVVELALRKASAVASTIQEGLVIGSDTTIAINGKILGKPGSAEGAVSMLRELRGKTHLVLSGLSIMDSVTHRVESGYATTRVTMREYSDNEIDRYVESGEPLDKAGSYAIQGNGRSLVSEIDGDFETVVGLPTWLVREFLRRLS